MVVRVTQTGVRGVQVVVSPASKHVVIDAQLGERLNIDFVPSS